jgi:Porin subfamily
MATGRIAAFLAAAGSLLSIAASAVCADELADLRANQELLQQRLDQLAQVPSAAGLYTNFPDPPGVEASGSPDQGGGSFRRSFLIPGTDTSLRIGGQISEYLTYFFTGGLPHLVGGTANTGGALGGAVTVVPLHVHAGPAVAGIFPLAGNPARSAGHAILYQTPSASRIQIQTRTPTAWGEARTFFSFDWVNSNQFVPGNNPLLSTNNLAPRLLSAYATLGGLLGGQAVSNFRDPDASPENVNFGGSVGDPGVTRQPQVRYTLPLAAWAIPGALSVSAEAPETDGITSGAGLIASDATSQAPSQTCVTAVAGAATCTATLTGVANPFKAPAPDLTAAWYIPQSWGHVDFSTVFRPTLQMKDGAFVNRTFQGWGVHFGGDVKPGWLGWAKDYITWQFVYGNGVGRYLTGAPALGSNYPVSAPGTAAAAADVMAKTVVAWGGNTGYQHLWSPTLRSNINAGIQHYDIANVGNSAGGFVCSAFSAAALSGSGTCGLNKELITAAVNVIWNPVPFAEVGLEYMWGHRLVVSNLKGDENVLIGVFRVNF